MKSYIKLFSIAIAVTFFLYALYKWIDPIKPKGIYSSNMSLTFEEFDVDAAKKRMTRDDIQKLYYYYQFYDKNENEVQKWQKMMEKLNEVDDEVDLTP